MNIQINLKDLLKGKELLIFDFDGTVADTSILHEKAFKFVLSPLEIDVTYSQIAGMKTREAMLYCIKKAGAIIPEDLLKDLISIKQEHVRKMMTNELRALEGVDNFLHWARQHYKLAMATSGSRLTVKKALEILGYTDWFSPLVCAEDVSFSKPDPECLAVILNLTGVKKSKALVFEDSEIGILAAERANLTCINVGHPEFSWAMNER
jgi:HAD superfamily hydrolase (TIGR01509 family)